MRATVALKLLWAAPCTALGLLPALLLCAAGASARRVGRVIEVGFDDEHHRVVQALERLPFCGITLGHLVLAPTHAGHHAIRLHERVHVAQYETWGPLFVLLYGASSAWQWLRGRQPYTDNHFERQARAGERVPGA